MNLQRPSWGEHAMNLAFAASNRSEDLNVKVGAAILDKYGMVLGVGYNGTVPGIDIDWSNREQRRPFVIHAEANALRYVTPNLARGGLMAVTYFPCANCLLLAASYGIFDIYWNMNPAIEYQDRWAEVKFVADKIGVNLSWIQV